MCLETAAAGHASLADGAGIDRPGGHDKVTVRRHLPLRVHFDLRPGSIGCPASGFSDCLVFDIARKARHIPLGSFDRDLAKLDGAIAVT